MANTFSPIDDYIQKLTAIHLILEMSGNRIFKTMLVALISLSHQIIKTLSPEAVYSLHRAGEHDNIVDSVLLGDPDGAEKSMTLHSNCFGEAFIKNRKCSSNQSGQNFKATTDWTIKQLSLDLIGQINKQEV